MNKDLKDFIDNYDTKGKSLKDFYYEVGVFHKTKVPQKERNWEELASYVDAGNGEAYRCYVKRLQAEDGSLPLKSAMTDKIIDEDCETYEDQIKALQKERIKTRDAVNSYRRYLREDARVERLEETIKDVAKSMKSLPKVKITKGKTDKKIEAVLLYSDLHIGADCSNSYNKYNTEVAQVRLGKLLADTIKYCKANKVQRLNFLNLGDSIHGAIHTDSRIEQEMDVISQVMTAAELTADFLNELQEAAPEIVYRSCSDNHSRVTANKAESLASENFGRLIDWYIEERLKNTKIKFVKDNLDYGLGKFDLANGATCMFAHGHEDTYNQVIQNWAAANNGKMPEYVFLAHFHSTKTKSFQGSKVFVNGSMCGTEQYAYGKRLFGKAEQTLFIFDGDNLVEHIINVQGVE